MALLEHLEPRDVFHFFEELCAIPHGSGNTKAVSDWCVAYAKSRRLEYYQDEANNVIIIQGATPGYEDVPAIILQGHLDMVCEKDSTSTKDMNREGLDLAVEGDRVYAKGTTLGGDDGIAVAMALAVLENPNIAHPRLEVVLTTDEEVGMLGAAALDVSPLQGRQLINIDSEEEGVFTVSCAGGVMNHCSLPLTRTEYAGARLRIVVSGLTGGHSGVEIHKGRANAIILLGRLLDAAGAAAEMRVVSAAGGAKDNAIAVSAEAVIAVSDTESVTAALETLAGALRQEYLTTDPGLCVTVESTEDTRLPMDADTTRRVLCFMTCAPNGVEAMSAEIPGLTQTSLNLGVMTCSEAELSAVFCIRSSVGSQKEMLFRRVGTLVEQLGGKVCRSGDYPAWEYRRDSVLRSRMTEIFEEQYGYAPKIEAIHGGLECGLLCGKLPDLDCVSIGPDMEGIHTARESLSVASVQRVWNFLLEVLKRSK